jgi:hypothetical protein
MILIHIIRKKKKILPTHIKHNSSKISDRSQKFAIDRFLHYNFWKN